MFVKSVSSVNNNSGIDTIIDVEANKTKEDYLLNFDYLYNVNNISAD